MKVPRAFQSILAVGALCVMAFVLRLFPYRQVFHDKPFADGSRIALYGTDPHYHVRRIRLTMAAFPRVQYEDTYLAYPARKAHVYWPPLFDWAIAGAAKALGYSHEDEEALLRFFVFIPPLVGAITVLVAYLLARELMGSRAAWISAGLFAFMPGHVSYSILSRVDHHVAEMLAVLLLFLLTVRAVNRVAESGRVPWGQVLACGAAVAGSLAVSVASLMFILLIAGYLWLSAVRGFGKAGSIAAPLLGFSGWMFLIAQILLGPLCGYVPARGGECQEVYIGLSLTYLYLLSGLVGIFFLTRLWSRKFSTTQESTRAPWVKYSLLSLILLTLVSTPIFFYPDLLAPFGMMAEYFWERDPWLASLSESQPLFFNRGSFEPAYAQVMLTRFIFLHPLFVLMLFLLWRRARERRPGFEFLLFWSAAMLPLGLEKKRLVYYLALNMSMAMGFSLVAGAQYLWRLWSRRVWVAGVLAVPIVLWALYPAVNFYWPISKKWAEVAPFNSAPAEVRETFAWIRDHTPPTEYYLSPTQLAEYGVLYAGDTAPWLITYARRPVVGAFWGVFGPEALGAVLDSFRFLLAESEEEAETICERGRVRYVVVAGPFALYVRDYAAIVGRDPDLYMPAVQGSQGMAFRPTPAYFRLIGHRLSECGAGTGSDSPDLQHYRLLYESRTFKDVFTGVPSSLKVFERVTGARITGRATPRADVKAEVKVSTNLGRIFFFRAKTAADREGRFVLIVPYATTASSQGTRAMEPYRVSCLAVDRFTHVKDQDVLEGRELKVVFPDVGR